MANLNGHEGGNAGYGQGEAYCTCRRRKLPAEGVEGRGWAKGNANRKTCSGHWAGPSMDSARDRMRCDTLHLST